MADGSTRVDARGRIVEAAARLLREEGPTGLTTRAAAQAAGVQAPTIYRLFGDKDGLLEAVAEHVMAAQVAAKAESAAAPSSTDADPVEDLRAGWADQVAFGVENPALFRLFSDPDRVARSAAARSGRRVLETRVHRIAAAGRLRVAEQHAVDLVQAAGVGTIQTLLAAPPDQRDAGLADGMLAAVLGRILVDAPEPAEHPPAATAVAFRTLVPRLDALTDAERRLLLEWVDRGISAL